MLDEVVASDTIYYKCNEYILDGTNAGAAASRDSLRKWGFCKVKTCPCPGNLELWRYSGDQPIQGIDNGGVVVTNPDKKGNGIGGLILNYILDFNMPVDTIKVPDSLYVNAILAPDTVGACKGQPVKIAIVDSGVKQPNQYLTSEHGWRAPAAGFQRTCNTEVHTQYGLNILGTTDSWEPNDDNGHGTHINGIIAGIAPFRGNGLGVPLECMNIKILGANKTGTLFDALCGLSEALDQGADVINVSWGFYDTLVPSDIFQPFFDIAKKRNVVLVAGLGNGVKGIGKDMDGVLKFWPACFANTCDNVISVGAMNASNRNLAVFSNWSQSGTYMTIAAPGDQILSTYPCSRELAYMSGTSMATPYVTRAVAVMIGLRKGEGRPITASEIKEILISTGIPDARGTFKRLNYGGKVNCQIKCGAVQCPPL